MTNKLLSSVAIVTQMVFLSGGVWAANGFSPPKRISGQILDLGKVHAIYMVPGMATLIEIPSSVTGIRLGNPDAVQYFRPDKPENEVTLVLKDSGAKPTNLIIRSNQKKYVFDIIPSREIHQDTIEVIGSYGGASIEGSGATLIDSSDASAARAPGGLHAK